VNQTRVEDPPTTCAVIAASCGRQSERCPEPFDEGCPKEYQGKQGTKVTQTVRIAARVAAGAAGERGVAVAARKPTNCHDHDEWSGVVYHAEAIAHLARLRPMKRCRGLRGT